MKIPNMANMEECRKPLTGVEHGNSPDHVAEAVRFVLGEQVRIEERLKTLENAPGITSPRDALWEKIMIGATFNQGGGT